MREIIPEELLVRYEYGERDFPQVKLCRSIWDSKPDLNGVNLSGINLCGADLRGVEMIGANLRGANLCGADLRDTILTEVNFSQTNLFSACLESAKLERAIIRNANLYSVNLCWCNLTGADLDGACLNHMNATNAYFCKAKVSPFEYAILADADFSDTNIPDQILCRGGNLIWRTIMSDGKIIVGPQYGNGQGK